MCGFPGINFGGSKNAILQLEMMRIVVVLLAIAVFILLLIVARKPAAPVVKSSATVQWWPNWGPNWWPNWGPNWGPNWNPNWHPHHPHHPHPGGEVLGPHGGIQTGGTVHSPYIPTTASMHGQPQPGRGGMATFSGMSAGGRSGAF